MVDVHSSASLTVIDRELLDNLPLDRRVIDFVNLAPGVTANTAFGGSLSANPFSLDGTDGNEAGWVASRGAQCQLDRKPSDRVGGLER
jgi:hypothetical protein